jgi:polyisoprenoid-binding protein YceI
MNTSRPSSFRRAALASGVALVIAASTLGVGAYSYLKPTATASAPVSAVPLTTMTVNLSTAQDSNSADLATADATVYEIQSTSSAASFIVDEVLRGSPYTVVGTTDQVAGQIAFDLADPSAAQVGTIQINARTLTTDDDSRTRALGNRILNSDQYEYISFTPTELSGLPDSAAVGQPFTFQMMGDLTIKGVTLPTTFDVTVTPAAEGILGGSASTTIRYADWGVSIPSVPFVASVDDQVVLQLDFRASVAA